MISPEFCRTMARYNAWQNRQIQTACAGMTETELRTDRGAFFGSILATLNHLLWGDMIWMSRFDGGPAPRGGIRESPDLCPTFAVWSADRFRMDGRIRQWAGGLHNLDLAGDLVWFSGAAGREVSKPVALCVTHMFNHQTHHRGQVHAMLTAAGQTPGDTDLFLMPEEV
nr:DinB family protein [Shimia biformata]